MVQTGALKEIDSALRGEYTVRRRMLIERAKVTLQSFMWAEKIQNSAELKQAAQAAAQQGEALMHNQPAVTLDDVFRAKQGASSFMFVFWPAGAVSLIERENFTAKKPWLRFAVSLYVLYILEGDI